MEHHLAAAAISAAWPGNTTLARFRRLIAKELVASRHGPLGPFGALGASLGSTFRAKYPKLVSETAGLCHPQDGSLRFAQLIAHGRGYQPGKSGEPGPEDVPGGAFMYCSRCNTDICVVLDLAALINWHAAKSPVGPRTPSESGGGGAANCGGASASGRHSSDDADDARLYGTRRTSVYDVVAGRGPGDGEAANAEDALAARPPLPSNPEDMSLRAFPGPAIASQLRRALVQRLVAAGPDGEGGLPPYTVPYRQLAPLVAASNAAALHPALTAAATLRVFVEHPASAGVFHATRIYRTSTDNSTITNNKSSTTSNNSSNNNHHEGSIGGAVAAAPAATVNIDVVCLMLPALRRAAGGGLLAAIDAAWPGGAPLQRLKRSAARELAKPWLAGPEHEMCAGPLGAALCKYEPLAYAAVRGRGGGGLMAHLDESLNGGYLMYV